MGVSSHHDQDNYIHCLLITRHMVVCGAAQEVSMPHCEYIDRKKENAIFTHVHTVVP